MRQAAVACGFLALLLEVLVAQAPSAPATPPKTPRPFKASVDVVSITATVVDGAGGYVSGLTRDDFEVFEDGQPQSITHFTGERVPVSLGLLLDTSDSMAKLIAAKTSKVIVTPRRRRPGSIPTSS